MTASDEQCLATCHLLKEELKTEDSVGSLWFGMQGILNGKIVFTYHSLSQDREKVEALVALLNKDGVKLNQIEFIMDSWYGTL